MSCGVRTFTRTAASSIARGRPSSRVQISATAAAFSRVRRKSGRTARARSTKREIASDSFRTSSSSGRQSGSGSRSGGTGNSRSPYTDITERLVTTTFSRGACESRCSTPPAAATTCSKLSRISKSSLSSR
jgi:hypothetical protein